MNLTRTEKLARFIRFVIPKDQAERLRMAEKVKEFVAVGSEIYHGNLPEGAKEHH